ncbi:MAG TPA: ribonuclease E inhibitor RraB [Terriglobales bacterium]|nr:ribonuclease E inhibitor RraB [Terriglobales bacterium]
MKEAEISGDILRHDARNLQLKRHLAERGIDWRSQCQTVCRFCGPEQQQAAALAGVLRRKGFLVMEPELLPGRSPARGWRVEAQRRQSIERSASHEFTEEMVRSAAAFSCLYEGWETAMAGEKS